VSPLLEVTHLSVEFQRDSGDSLIAVDDVSLAINAGELVALVGESGCGKSLTGLALPGLLPDGARLGEQSRIVLDGAELTALSPSGMRQYRGRRIAMVFQDPASSLNPVMRVGDQVIEAIEAHRKIGRQQARQRAVELLAEVGIADAGSIVDAWPHELSGGMRQRVMLAIALAGEPDLLIADEPTTALDVTVQAQILELIDRLRIQRSLAVLLITHDLGIVASRADRVLVMYAGRIVEQATTARLFDAPMHPYTRGLLAAIPRIDVASPALQSIAGTVPSPTSWPEGCRFHPRCPLGVEQCSRVIPPLVEVNPDHRAACIVTTALEVA
jgi:peptide/nickel transport system ATP-binding protein